MIIILILLSIIILILLSLKKTHYQVITLLVNWSPRPNSFSVQPSYSPICTFLHHRLRPLYCLHNFELFILNKKVNGDVLRSVECPPGKELQDENDLVNASLGASSQHSKNLVKTRLSERIRDISDLDSVSVTSRISSTTSHTTANWLNLYPRFSSLACFSKWWHPRYPAPCNFSCRTSMWFPILLVVKYYHHSFIFTRGKSNSNNMLPPKRASKRVYIA